jgi:hypothetical protein
MENYTIKEFFGFLFLAGIFIWLTFIFFDGIGIFRDVFYTSGKSSYKKDD